MRPSLSGRPAVSLTPFGIEFIRGIEQIYELENHLHDMADELRTLQSGIVSIGGSNLSSDYIVPERIVAFKTKYPNVTLRASEASTIQCKQMLDTGDLDLVITNRPLDTESYEAHRLLPRKSPAGCPVAFRR